MSATVQYLPERGAVVVKYAGMITPEVMARQTQRGIELVKQHGSARVLVDCSEIVEMRVNTLDVYRQPDALREGGVSVAVRIALVLPHGEVSRELFHFYDDTAHNRGYDVRLCETHNEAWAWLAG